MEKNQRAIAAALMALGAVGFGSSASALPILEGSFVSGGEWDSGAADVEGRQASALFTATGTTGFTIVLSNDALVPTTQPNELLAGLIIDFGFDAMISSVGVAATGGIGCEADALACLDPQTELFNFYGEGPFGDSLNGEWGYLEGADTNGRGGFVIGGVGYDPLGINPVIDPTESYIPSPGTGGPDFLIAGADITGIVSQPLRFWAEEFITISFTTEYDFSGFDWSSLDQVHFLYGTSFETTVPEPGTLALFGVGLLGLAFSRRRFSRS